MNMFTFFRYSFGLAAVAALSACTVSGSAQSTGSSAGALPQGTVPTRMSAFQALVAANRLNRQPDRHKSWMSPQAKRHTLLYVGSEDTEDVYVYTYPRGKLVGTLTGFLWAFGECSDSAGHVWITNGFSSDVFEYAHGGTTPIATLRDPGQGPYGCAVDPKSGNLAVANYVGVPSGPGSISVYAKAQGHPKVYADPNSADEMFVGYDKGRLYVEGINATTGTYQLAAFAKKHFTDLTISGATLSYPGGVGFDNGLWIGDGGNGSKSTTGIYQIKVRGTTATVTGDTPLTNGNDCGQELAYHGVALCPGDGGQYAVLFYKYPAGGLSYKSVGDIVAPFGVAISK